jgi:hypothetical protein
MLAFKDAPDYETPTDANSDNVYEVAVQADDGSGRMATQTINVTVTDVLEIPGDYNASGNVDYADYDVWRSAYGQAVMAPGQGADGNSDSVVDTADYVVWRRNLGQPAGILFSEDFDSLPSTSILDGQNLSGWHVVSPHLQVTSRNAVTQ